jgi:hypothetical protein
VSQDESEEENNNVNILAKEIKLWKDFEYVLRDENAFLFNEILSEQSPPTLFYSSLGISKVSSELLNKMKYQFLVILSQ